MNKVLMVAVCALAMVSAVQASQLMTEVMNLAKETGEMVTAGNNLYTAIKEGDASATALWGTFGKESNDVLLAAIKIAADKGDLQAVDALTNLPKSIVNLSQLPGLTMGTIAGLVVGYFIGALGK